MDIILNINTTVWKVSKCGVISGKVSLRIHSECGKIRTRNNSVFGHFARSVRIPFFKFRVAGWIRNKAVSRVERGKVKSYIYTEMFFFFFLFVFLKYRIYFYIRKIMEKEWPGKKNLALSQTMTECNKLCLKFFS